MNVSSYKTRDKYGRTVTHFTVNARTVAVVVTLPKRYADETGHKYLVNDWASESTGDVTYFAKRKDAVQHAEAVQAREAAKVAA